MLMVKVFFNFISDTSEVSYNINSLIFIENISDVMKKDNWVYVDNESGFNQPATITFKSVNNPKQKNLLKDGEFCVDCENITYGTDTIEFDVSGFSNYSYENNTPPNAPTLVAPDNASTVTVDENYVELAVNYTDPNGDEGANGSISFYNASDSSLIGTVSNVDSGSTARLNWSVDKGQTYSWYVVANDSSFTNTSDTWTFSTHTDCSDGDSATVCYCTDTLSQFENISGDFYCKLNESLTLQQGDYDIPGSINITTGLTFDGNNSNITTDGNDVFQTRLWCWKYHIKKFQQQL